MSSLGSPPPPPKKKDWRDWTDNRLMLKDFIKQTNKQTNDKKEKK
jgi:hypothetical protein